MSEVDAQQGGLEALFAGTPYRGLERLGAGGMGEVILVEHRETSRLCVAKLIHRGLAGDARLVDRARLEAQALGRLEHPHVVSVLGVGVTADERAFLILEHLKGRTLKEELRERGRLPAAEALLVGRQILSALGAAHALGIVHRDLKPDNVFLCAARSGKPHAKVFDFGVARVLPGAPPRAPAPLALPTEEGEVLGTPRYMSPEAALGRPVDERADLYAVGLLLYEMLTGRGPFDALGRSEIVEAHAREPAPPLPRGSAEPLPATLEALLARALAKDPAARPQSAEEFQVLLEGILESPADRASLDRVSFERASSSATESPVDRTAESSVDRPSAGRASTPKTRPFPSRRSPGDAPSSSAFGGRSLFAAFLLATLLGFLLVALLGAFGALPSTR